MIEIEMRGRRFLEVVVLDGCLSVTLAGTGTPLALLVDGTGREMVAQDRAAAF